MLRHALEPFLVEPGAHFAGFRQHLFSPEERTELKRLDRASRQGGLDAPGYKRHQDLLARARDRSFVVRLDVTTGVKLVRIGRARDPSDPLPESRAFEWGGDDPRKVHQLATALLYSALPHAHRPMIAETALALRLGVEGVLWVLPVVEVVRIYAALRLEHAARFATEHGLDPSVILDNYLARTSQTP